MEQLSISWEPPRNQYTVAEITTRIQDFLTHQLSNVWIAGEISSAKLAPSGHWYFTLKDNAAQLKCACFRMNAMRLRVKPQDGLSVIARGRMEIYAARGEYQLIVEAIELQGVGALQLAFEQLKRKLAADGLFETARKRPLPRYPQRVGIVTSPSGAAVQDMLNVLRRRAPGLHIRLYPAMVQGEGAALQIARGVRFFSEDGWAEVVIVGRGGGSLEDLWAFNEEPVAVAIYQSLIPVVSAVGHETDFTIADFTADLRAPTPSAAAEMITHELVSLSAKLAAETRHLEQAMRLVTANARDRLSRRGIDRVHTVLSLKLNRGSQRIDELDYKVRDVLRRLFGKARDEREQLDRRLRRRDLRVRMSESRSKLNQLDFVLRGFAEQRIRQSRPRLSALSGALEQLNPLRVLDRGYAIVQTLDGSVVKQPPAAGTDLRIRLADGETRARTLGEAAATPDDNSELPS